MEKCRAPVTASTAELEMTPEDALEIGMRFGNVYKRAAVSIDADPSSPVIGNALIAGLNAAGTDVVFEGIVPAPAVCFACAQTAEIIVCVGSPDGYGLPSVKFHRPDGSQLSEEDVSTVLGDGPFALPSSPDIGDLARRNDANDIYIKGIRNSGIRADGLAILDCGCGSTALVAPYALSETGSDVSGMNTHIARRAPRNPRIGRTDLLPLGRFVSESAGSIGVAYNGDGTRLAVVDESGRCIPGDSLLALMLMYTEPRVAVIPFDSPAIVEDAFRRPLGLREDGSGKEEGRRIVRTKNDISAIVRAIRDSDADIGALNDGTFIFPAIGLCPDAIYASAVISELARARSLRNVLEDLPNYTSRETKVPYGGDLELFGRRLLQKMVEYDVDEIYVGDGAWRIVMRHGGYIISPDGEGCLNIKAEASDPMYLVSMMGQAVEIVRWCVSEKLPA